MEISKGLQQEIQLVQNKLKNAIRDHQICVAKLKDDPNNADVLGRIQEIQLHIVALGRCQKQVVQRLRKEVESFKADNENEVKVSVASLLGLNNNNHITADNEATTDEISEVKTVTNGLDNVRLTAAKDDYEEIVRNGDVVGPPRGNVRKKKRSLSVEALSAEDEITEVMMDTDDNTRYNQPEDSDSPEPEPKVNCGAQLNFLEILGLITTSKFTELQNRRAERKRRSTANPQFVYSNWEIPTKRKRHNYLQSAGNVPQTRQTTARLNGPSPPPSTTTTTTATTTTTTTNKPPSVVPPPKSTSPPSRTIAKSLIPTQKTTARPNILRNMAESRVFANKTRLENGNGQVQLSSGNKTVQPSCNSKTVHIPGLPLGLTIERIENDSAVCINCRNPGTLTNCDNCEANYHVSCHTISPPPPRLCPKCALRMKDPTTTATIKKNDELEEKERERYEQRERNSDLRLQVYELEKRSQLLGQSLQLQHRTRQELLGKQEKTQKSIKRLADFIKLVQLRNSPSTISSSNNNSNSSSTSSNNKSSSMGEASTSYYPRPSSSRSPRTPSPKPPVSPTPTSSSPIPRASTSSSPPSKPPPPQSPPRPINCPTTRHSSSVINSRDPTSHTYPNHNPTSPTPINCPSTLQKPLNHFSSSKKSLNPEQRRTNEKSTMEPHHRQDTSEIRSSETNPEPPIPKFQSSKLRRNSTDSPDVSPSRSLAVGKNLRYERFPVSIESFRATEKSSETRLTTRTTTTWMNYRASRTTTSQDKPDESVNSDETMMKNCEISQEEIIMQDRNEESIIEGTMDSRTKTWKLQRRNKRTSSNSEESSTVTNIVQNVIPVYSTQCSQAITSPIPSPIVLTARPKDHHRSSINTEISSTLATTSSSGSTIATKQSDNGQAVTIQPHPPNT